MTDLFCTVTVASFSFALVERDKRNSIMMSACTRTCRRNERSVIYPRLAQINNS